MHAVIPVSLWPETTCCQEATRWGTGPPTFAARRAAPGTAGLRGRRACTQTRAPAGCAPATAGARAAMPTRAMPARLRPVSAS